jgi:opacity protein-like surface antigen
MSAAVVAADLEPEPVYTTGSWYIRGDFGVGIADADNQLNDEAAFAVGAGLGYRFTELFRADITFDGAFDYDFGNGVDAYGVLANGYIDIPLGWIVTPYLGAGIGWGQVDGNGINDDGVSFAGMGGISFDFSSNMSIDVGYKYRYIDLTASQTGGVSYWADHLVRAGLRYSF